MNKGRGIAWAIAGSWLAATCTAVALPLAPEPAAREKPRTEVILSNDAESADKRSAVIREVAQEVRRTGPGIAPSLGIDDGFLNQGNLLQTELREQGVGAGMDHWARQKGRGPGPDAGPDIFRETIDSALRATRDAFFEGGDTANFSLAGIELSVTLRGERRGLSVNGYDLLASNQQVVIGGDVLQPASMKTITGVPQETPIVLSRGGEGDGKITLADVRKFFLQPFTIAGMIGLLGVWVVFAMAVSRARQE